jgi:hypothetical protein
MAVLSLPNGQLVGPWSTPAVPGEYQSMAMIGGVGQAQPSPAQPPAPAPVQGSSQSQGGPPGAPGQSRPSPAAPAPTRGTFGYAPAPAAFTPGAAPAAVAFGAAPTMATQAAAMPPAPAPPPPQQQMPNPQAHQVLMNTPPLTPMMGSIQAAMAAPAMDQFQWTRRPWQQGW